MTDAATWVMASGPDQDVVIATRARLARNLVGYRFPHRASDAEREQVALAVQQALRADEGSRWWVADSEHSAGSIDRMAPAMAPPAFGKYTGEVLAGSSDGHSYVLINEEDHLRIVRLDAGLAVDRCLGGALAVEGSLARHLSIALDPDFGHLTASLANVGHGLRLSVMMHLPALATLDSLGRLFRAAERLGLTARGVYGEGTRGLGHIYQLSNQGAATTDPQRITVDVHAAAAEVVAAERDARADLAQRQIQPIEAAARQSAHYMRRAEWVGVDLATLLWAWSDVRLGRVLGVDVAPPVEELTAILALWGRRLGTLTGAAVLNK